MNNVHVHLHVSNIEASRAFYERFLGTAPVKVKPGYVKFLPEFAPINLALSAGEASAGKTVDHLGFQVDSKETVQRLLAQAKAAGLSVREEMDTNCCYANQDKFWVRDPDGVEWEIYHLNFDIDEDVAASGTTCCAPAITRIGKRPS
ncbi:MAG TPA: ArsI/CadI family heavy metal resistance metalloenzyme [Polyangia bacterium]|jgi:lactoylglutathione lyase